MNDYIAIDAGAIYNGEHGIVEFDDFYIKANNRQEVVDFIFSRIINNDKNHLRALNEILSIPEYHQVPKPSNKTQLKKFIDRSYHIKMEVYERSSIDREKLKERIDNKYTYESTGKPIFVKDLSDIEIVKHFSGDYFYDLEWRKDLLDSCGILHPSRLSDKEIKEMLILDSKYNSDFDINPEELENKIFLI